MFLIKSILRDFNNFWTELSARQEVDELIQSRDYQIASNFNVKIDHRLSPLQYRALFDALWCCKKLGHSATRSSGTKEGHFLLLWYLVINYKEANAEMIYDEKQMSRIESDVWKDLIIINNQYSDYAHDPLHEMELSRLLRLSHTTKDQALRYDVLMYRFATIMADLDHNVTPEEKEWIKELMQRQSRQSQPLTECQTWEESSEELSEELHSLIGLDNVKEEIRAQECLIKIQKLREKHQLATLPQTYHYVFTGNPGTGKTTIARILAKMYHKLGLLSKGHLIEADRSTLVAEWLGQTEAKTNAVIDRAIGGVLFIDEAYALTDDKQDSYGQQAVNVLLKRMEDERNDLMVILAGYPDNMDNFIKSNPGLQSRFNRKMHFADYTSEELCLIFMSLLEKYQYKYSGDFIERLQTHLEEVLANGDPNFGNGRYVRNLFELCILTQSIRLCEKKSISQNELESMHTTDLLSAIARM